MNDLFAPLTFARGPAWKNRFMLAPLTNCQSHADGSLSDEEFHWLTLRARGGFGLVMTCAAHVQAQGQGFPGQLGVYSDHLLPGLARLAAKIRADGAVSAVQLHHAGLRSPADLIGHAPVGPSEDAETGTRALSTDEVEQLAEDFIAAAVRAETAGFDGVEIHGAHGYIVCAFLSPQTNRRDDRYGGSPAARARLLKDIISGVRARCRPDFQLGLRLSPERFGLVTADMRDLAAELMTGGGLDYLDMSLWDVFKPPVDPAFKDRPLIEWFAELPRGRTRLGVAGKIMSAANARRVLEHGCDFAVVGRAAVLHHDLPQLIAADPAFEPIARPVSRDHLRREGLSPIFIDYMDQWKGFVAPEATSETRNEDVVVA
jgi:2,4-dienoyl-CoA reductase-like NADH-dependent reductase (Old Yellow Enzyme family)